MASPLHIQSDGKKICMKIRFAGNNNKVAIQFLTRGILEIGNFRRLTMNIKVGGAGGGGKEEGKLLSVRTRAEAPDSSCRKYCESKNQKEKVEEEEATDSSCRNYCENENQKEEAEEEEEEEPISPKNRWLLYTPIRTVVVIETSDRADAAEVREFLLAVYRHFPRLSCVVKEDRQGNIRLYREQLNIDRHMFFAELPEEEKEQEKAVDEYVAKLETTELDHSKPLWEWHVLSCATKTVTLFKLHQALADGVSVLASVFAVTRSAEDPSRMPKLPRIGVSRSSPATTQGQQQKSLPSAESLLLLLLTPMIAVADVLDVGLRMLGLRCDTVFPREQITAITETQAGDHRRVLLSLPVIKSIKNMAAATVNDVICGIIFHAFKGYLEIRDAAAEAKISIEMAYERRSELLSASAMMRKRKPTKFTAAIPLNTRAMAALMEMQGTITEKCKVSWGNHFVIIFLDICLERGDTVWEAIRKVKRIVDTKKKSAYLQLSLMHHLTRYLNLKTTALCFERALGSASVGVTNVLGPTEKMSMNSTTITQFRYTTAPIPHALEINLSSYVDEMTVNVVAFRPFIDINIFCKFLHESFAEVASAVKTVDP